ncbi:MAG: cell division protein ZapA [Chitinophagia bacterium]|nr:cell division protein ZapA [Chitinophagia bacterium]
MQQNIPVNVLVGDRTYRVLVAPSDEERLRKMAKAINDQILEFRTRFGGKDMQDYLAMVLLWHLSESRPGAVGGAGMAAVTGELTSLESMLDSMFLPSGSGTP